ncbi:MULTISPECIES: hypothetical protein [Enterobacter cloacae complex]|uniref:hypothetical protein n=1 Tax=Enterobacter cloacae complex TaxID=354276 RepID=UPI000793E0F1|nr:hypothetical protein [Enterobacter ludwigii]MBX8879175.1 hypothetical protein [Enterobacter ludwigii]SAB65173.1 Uncharacterised protein [Enterobacter ludwigii]HDR2561479.1 hypothetical protein [Enterobacter ludwigii]HDR2580741.1 hypothetical protein [Enterobacter ludwigii]
MSTFTRAQLIARINQVTAINKYRISRDTDAEGLAMDNELFAIALASLEAEPVMYAMAGEDLDADATSASKAVVDAWVEEWNQVGEPGYRTVTLYTALPAPVVPNGWVLVPKEPTPAMLNAAWVSHGIYHASAYRTMLAAAPQQEVK